MTLKDLQIGRSAVVKKVGGEDKLKRHFLDMGIVPGAELKIIKSAPLGDPIEIRVFNYDLALRIEEANKIEVEEVCIKREKQKFKLLQKSVNSSFHKINRTEKELKKPFYFALAGNQNCGKTTLFNQLTGANCRVGNFPGVTIERKYGKIKNTDIWITDLPGIYSLSPYSDEEIISRKYILDEKPVGIINIIDAMNIERNMYLTMQLMELHVPMVVALNMMDEVESNGINIDISQLEKVLGVPVIPISASKNRGIKELILCLRRMTERQFDDNKIENIYMENGSLVTACVGNVMSMIKRYSENAKIPALFAASKVTEGDRYIWEQLKISEEEKVNSLVAKMEKESCMDRMTAVAAMRFSFVRTICANIVRRGTANKNWIKSQKIDRILTDKFLALPIFMIIMSTVFFLTFNVIGEQLRLFLDVFIEFCISKVEDLFLRHNVNDILHALVVDGIMRGVGAVISFVPIIVVLFFFLSVLEDSGYMARVAFIMDKLLNRLGLSGKSIVPLLIGFGCTVPGVMATRTLPSRRDKIMTILLTPYMSCSAKIPIYAFLATAFFDNFAWLVMVGLYFLGIFVGVIAALIYKIVIFKGESAPFVMELPTYRMPTLKNISKLLWDKSKDFLTRAFTVILLSTMAIWTLQLFDFKLNIVDAEQSMLASLSNILAPVFKPLGFSDWRIVASLISGVIAKESVVSDLCILGLSQDSLRTVLSPCAGLSLMVFCLLYTPCIAAIASIRRELGGKWAAFTVILQCVVAWLCAAVVSTVGNLVL